jgi:hypothetical protein
MDAQEVDTLAVVDVEIAEIRSINLRPFSGPRTHERNEKGPVSGASLRRVYCSVAS